MGETRHSVSSSNSGSSGSVTAYDVTDSKQTDLSSQPSPNTISSHIYTPNASDLGDESEGDFPAEPVPGWPKLASLMAETPDLAAFSRFRDLNVKSLLYYQAQLTALRKKLHQREYTDRRGHDPDARKYAKRIDFLVDDEESEQFQLVEKMRKVLKAYNKAILEYYHVSALPEPEAYNMRSLRKWLRNKNHGDFKIRGEGTLEHTWGSIYENPNKNAPGLWAQLGTLLKRLIWPRPPLSDNLELVATKPQIKIDGMTQWVVWYWIPFCISLKKVWRKRKTAQSDPEKDSAQPTAPRNPERQEFKAEKAECKKPPTLEIWSERSALRFTSGFSTVVACLLPVVAITVLSQLHGTRSLLLCLASFSVFFAMGLIALTQGTSSRVEIFMATAAFSAVMVVFISVPVVVLPPTSGSPTSTPVSTI